MGFMPRMLTKVLLDASRHFPAVVAAGPRRAGETPNGGDKFAQMDANSMRSGSCTEEACTRNLSAMRGCLRLSGDIWPPLPNLSSSYRASIR